MKKDREFARRIKGLYEKRGADAGDLRSEELSTMFDLFLGETYDKARKVEITRVQADLHNKQELLANRFRAGDLNADEYMNSLNSLIGEEFEECRRILGSKDFKRLFGASYTKEKDFVDRSVFLAGTATEQARQPLFEDYGRDTFDFKSGLPSEAGLHVGLKMTNREVRGAVVVDLDGRIVLGQESNALREHVKSLLASNQKKIVLNMDKVTFIDSAGLGALVAAHHSARLQKASLKLSHLGSKFQEVLQITKLLTMFDVYDSETAAVRSFTK